MSYKLASPFCLLAWLFMLNLPAKAQPVAHFSASLVSGCAPLVVSFHDESTGTPTQWKWNLGNATISYLQHPVATYFNPGTYNIKLLVQNAAGQDSISIDHYITVHAAPVVNFTTPVLMGCAPFTIQLENQTNPGSGNLESWLWDFGDGNFSSAENPAHVYSNPGNYNVSLKATNNYGCTKTFTQPNYITVAPLVHAGFTHSAPTGCTAPETIRFTNTSTGTGVLSYGWLFGDGSSSGEVNPVHTYNSAGIYTVQLISTSATGCRDTFTLQNLNIASVHTDFTVPAVACANGAPLFFTANNTPAADSVKWSFGDNTYSTAMQAAKAYSTAGVYTVKLIAFFGACKDSVSKEVVVSPKPVTLFSASSLTSCGAPMEVNFTSGTGNAVDYFWTFGDGSTSTAASPTHTYLSSGTYSVRLITSNAAGCSDTLNKVNYIRIIPPQVVINQLPQQGCVPFTHRFAATVTSIDPVISYHWDFGDGSTSSGPNPTHTFNEGLYNIKLVITTSGCCRDSVTIMGGIRASLKPQANFSANPTEVCAFTPVQFNESSTGTITQWLWSFGDGGTSTGQNPSHQYQDTGHFNVTLIASNYGCKDTLVRPRYVHVNPPIARFNVNKDCDLPYVRNFIDSSSGADEWAWDFGDGNTSAVQHPSHTYSSTGAYNVTLVVKNNRTGCSHQTNSGVVIADENADFTTSSTELCRRSAVQFSALEKYPGGITTYNWNFGDGATAAGKNVSHTYSLAGNYNVQLIIRDAAGCTDTLLKNNHVRVNGPAANFVSSVPGTCLLTAVTFNDQSATDGLHPITAWKWNYGDGITEQFSAAPFSHSYNNAGNYAVTLTVTDAFGCVDSVRKTNIITISRPVAAFSTADTLSCVGAPIRFTNASAGPGLRYNWNFGDGTSSTEAAPVHHFNAEGSYNISLFITDQYGCTDEKLKSAYVRILMPIARFEMSDSISTCPPLIVQFTNSSVNHSTYHWDFGDGNFSDEASPSHFYNVAGTYYPKLMITSAGGCSSFVQKRVQVNGPSGSFAYPDFTGCKPLTVQFKATTHSRSSFVWDFNDGTTILSEDSVVSHTYYTPGIYVPKMILRDVAGCAVPIVGKDTIVVSGVAAAFDADKKLLCSNGIVQFSNQTLSNDVIRGYSWDFGDGSSSSQAAPSHYYATEGNYTVKLKAFTAMGCIDSTQISAAIKVVRTPSVSISQTANGCVPLTKSFTAHLLNADTSFIHWNWQLSNGIEATSPALNAVLFAQAGNFQAQLIATNSSGCKDTAMALFEAFAIPEVKAGADITVCLGTAKSLTATGAATYLWSPSTGLNCTACASPQANPKIETTYAVTGTSSQGCVKTDSVKVAVKYPFKMTKGRAATICLGEHLTLTVAGAASYAWSPSAGLNSANMPLVKAGPSVSTTYMAIGSDEPGCFKDTAYFPIRVYPVPTVEAGADITMNVGQSITLTPKISADVTEVYWSPTGSIFRSQFPSIDIKPKQTTQYKVEARNPGGCAASDQLTVNVLCNGANVFIPNTFSPNGDGVNEIFYPRGTGLFTIKSAKVFSRWGELVFDNAHMQPNDASGGWDGSFKGKQLPSDVFVYMIEIVCDNNTVMIYKGDIALIR